jgi:hypothetical protein
VLALLAGVLALAGGIVGTAQGRSSPGLGSVLRHVVRGPMTRSLVVGRTAAASKSVFVVVALHSAGVVSPGHLVSVSGRVSPAAPGKSVRLEKRFGGSWRRVASRALSKRSAFSFRVRVSGVGGHFLRVVKPAGSGRGQGVSALLEVLVSGHRSVRSSGGALSVELAGVRVSAPAGAIEKGQTLSISVGAGGGSSEPGVLVAGGPYLVSTSQGEPTKPVTVTFPYDPGLLAKGDKPLVVHDSTVAHGWIPVGTTVDATTHTVSATIGSFSLLGVIDGGTYYAGLLRATARICLTALAVRRRRGWTA